MSFLNGLVGAGMWQVLRHMSSVFLVCFGLLGMAFGAQAQSSAPKVEKAGDAILIMDYSNSMWGQIEGTAKIQIARDIIERNFDDWNRLTNLGVLAYGHRRKNDCGDIELIARPGETDAAQIIRFLNQAQPRGRTPLASSIEAAAAYFESANKEANIILLTDGIESCDRDPCATVEALQAQGLNLTAHVIGFGLSGGQGEQISCIASATGGQYLSADDADTLDEAFRRTIEQIQLGNDLADLNSALKEAQNDLLNLAMENSQLRGENEDLKTALGDLQSNLYDCQDLVAALEAGLDDVTAERDALQDMVNNLRKDLDGLRDDLVAARADLDNLRDQNKDLRAALEASEAENENLRAVIAAMMADISKANAPLVSAFERGAALGIAASGGMDVPEELDAAATPGATAEDTMAAALPQHDRVDIFLSENDASPLNDLEWSVRGVDPSGATLVTATGFGNSFELPSMAGRYEVAVSMTPYVKRFAVQVKEDERQVHAVTMNMAQIMITDARADEEPVLLTFEDASGVLIEELVDGERYFYLPAGSYTLSTQKGEVSLSRNIDLKIGERIVIPLRSI